MISISLMVNGKPVQAQVEPRLHLADFLREHLQLTATHLGCEHGVCGACTVLLDGAPVRACITLAASCEGTQVRTLEGLLDEPLLQRLQQAFHTEHGLQCGFCTPGMLVSAFDLLARKPDADAPTIRHDMSGNLCRCTGYQGIVRAIERAAGDRPPPATPSTYPGSQPTIRKE